MLFFDMVTRIDRLVEELDLLIRNLKESDHWEYYDPLIEQLSDESVCLREIYNEFCRIEMESL